MHVDQSEVSICHRSEEHYLVYPGERTRAKFGDRTDAGPVSRILLINATAIGGPGDIEILGTASRIVRSPSRSRVSACIGMGFLEIKVNCQSCGVLAVNPALIL